MEMIPIIIIMSIFYISPMIISILFIIHNIQIDKFIDHQILNGSKYWHYYKTKFQIISDHQRGREDEMILLISSFLPIINYYVLYYILINQKYTYSYQYEYSNLFYNDNIHLINYDIIYEELYIIILIINTFPLKIRKFKNLEMLLNYLKKKDKNQYYIFEKTLFTIL